MSPEPRYGEDIPDDIMDVVRDVRLSQIQEHLDLDVDGLPADPNSSAAPVENSALRPLDEHRHENAYRLAEALDEEGYEPYIVWGVTTAIRDKRLHNLSIAKLDRMSNRTHFWVELKPDRFNEPIVADICARIDGHHNTAYVSTDEPIRYQRMAEDPSYLEFAPALSPDNINTETGYEKLREAHPDLFAEHPWRDSLADFSDIPHDEMESRHITEIIERLDGIRTEDDLKDAIWRGRNAVYDALDGAQITTLAKVLDWNDYEFPQKNEDSIRQHSMVLEVVDNTELAILGPDGCVYQLGDVVRFETTRSRRGWGSSTSSDTVTRENQIDYLSENHISISRHPTYSNVPRDSPSATPGDTDIELVERSDLSAYRERLTEGTDIEIPESVNGWELVDKDTREDDPEDTLLPSGFVTTMQWSNGENTYVTAKWRGSYQCWRLSVPVEGMLTEENVDEYMYEIDVPQQVVTTESILELATEAMETMNPDDFQDPYDLRDPSSADKPSDMRAGFVPVSFPEEIGDWQLTERDKYSLVWKNVNEGSAWEAFTVKIDSHGGVVVKNVPDDEIHDRRLIKKYFPSGDPHPENVETEDYAWRRREMFDDNWYYGVSFLVQTSKQAIDEAEMGRLNEQTPDDVEVGSFDHELSTNPVQSMDRDNGTLLAYT
ncbi:hypothetical protein [Halosimplex pelagicum]|uniref:Uncharacterized protein n=1 Tax=Halosimplex pelagicum TaxID=869886 RepID=A0A7D5TUF6_9EURY|nr:hypothetical protein [Halosimplex pelagicum]QLH82294.1 hypothetical protein HZS54_12025 [Halosimplex pelagicum]